MEKYKLNREEEEEIELRVEKRWLVWEMERRKSKWLGEGIDKYYYYY